MTPQEQAHIANALTFEFGKVDIPGIRRRVLGHIGIIDAALGNKVADGLGMAGEADKINPGVPPIQLDFSPALRLYGKYEPTLRGEKWGSSSPRDSMRRSRTRWCPLYRRRSNRGHHRPEGGRRGGCVRQEAHRRYGLGRFTICIVRRRRDSRRCRRRHGPGDESGRDRLSGRMPGRAPQINRPCRRPGLTDKVQARGVGVTDLGNPKAIGAFIKLARNGKVWEREVQ